MYLNLWRAISYWIDLFVLLYNNVLTTFIRDFFSEKEFLRKIVLLQLQVGIFSNICEVFCLPNNIRNNEDCNRMNFSLLKCLEYPLSRFLICIVFFYSYTWNTVFIGEFSEQKTLFNILTFLKNKKSFTRRIWYRNLLILSSVIPILCFYAKDVIIYSQEKNILRRRKLFLLAHFITEYKIQELFGNLIWKFSPNKILQKSIFRKVCIFFTHPKKFKCLLLWYEIVLRYKFQFPFSLFP